MSRTTPTWLVLLCLAGCGGAGPDLNFRPFVGLDQAPNPLVDRLCAEAADPAGAADKVFIDCRLEGASFAPPDPPAVDELVVLTWNLERGLELDEQIAHLVSHPDLPRADVLLLSEVDRGCDRVSGRNVAWELAEALGMNYVFATEFVELVRMPDSEVAECEHGNAILSRFALGNVRAIRHQVQHVWYEVDNEPRLGGRIALEADTLVGDRLVRLISVHFESLLDEAPRAAQAAETADHGLTAGHLAVAGGDLNAGFFSVDLVTGTKVDQTVRQFTERGWVDAHQGLDAEARATAHSGLILDFLLATEAAFSAPGICPSETCGALSDHLPVWATVQLH